MDEPALPEPPLVREFAKASWGSLAFDLVLREASLPDILATYNLTEQHFAVLLTLDPPTPLRQVMNLLQPEHRRRHPFHARL